MITRRATKQDQLVIEADLPEETGQEQNDWITALGSHAATDVYEFADDYEEIECLRDTNQHDWSQDCKTLAMTQKDLNNLPHWIDEVKAAHKIMTNDGDLGGTPTQLNLKQSVAFVLIRLISSTSMCTDRTTSNSFYSIFWEQQEQARASSSTL